MGLRRMMWLVTFRHVVIWRWWLIKALSRFEVPVTCRLDTQAEVDTYNAGGVLQKFAQDFLKGKVV